MWQQLITASCDIQTHRTGHTNWETGGSLVARLPNFQMNHWDSGILNLTNSSEKWLHNGICYPSNRSKQIKETHMVYSAGTQYMRQSFNESQQHWLHKQQDIVCEAMYAVFHSNFAAYIVCQHYKPCEFLGFVWTDCWSNKSSYVITSLANRCYQLNLEFVRNPN